MRKNSIWSGLILCFALTGAGVGILAVGGCTAMTEAGKAEQAAYQEEIDTLKTKISELDLYIKDHPSDEMAKAMLAQFNEVKAELEVLKNAIPTREVLSAGGSAAETAGSAATTIGGATGITALSIAGWALTRLGKLSLQIAGPSRSSEDVKVLLARVGELTGKYEALLASRAPVQLAPAILNTAPVATVAGP